MNKLLIIIILFGGIFLLGSQYAPINDHDSHDAHFIDEIKAHHSTIEYHLNRGVGLDTADLIKVHSSIPNLLDFFTEKRTDQLASFACSNCHSESLSILKRKAKSDEKKAHWDIAMVHAKENTMNCKSCHSADDMNYLTSVTGVKIDINESFQLCSQCHSTQYNDWLGGAHGKQLNGWSPPRVSKTCVSCHDPHQPAFPKRFPARLNTQNAEE